MKRFLLWFTMLCLAAIALKAQTITWTGAGDGTNWSDANNWDLLSVPSIANDVIIPEGDVTTGGNEITINEHAYAKSVTIHAWNTLDIYNNITFIDESLVEFSATINWYQGDINSGETGPSAHVSTITNKGTVYIRSAAASLSYCVLINEGGIGILSTGALFLLTRSELRNQTYGSIDLHDDSNILPIIPIPGYYTIGVLNNYGLVESGSFGGAADISVPVNNHGIIEARLGDINFLNFDLHNTIEGTIKGTKAIKLPETAEFINNGNIEPGASPGKLKILGDFTSSSTSKLKVELNGYTQGYDYDVLEIQGDAEFNGYVDVSLGFAPSVNDELIVATTTGAITQCDLEPTTFAAFEGNIYEFDVACQNNKEVVLKLTSIEPGQTITWTGNGDGTNWTDPNNWDLLAVPTKDNDVIIRGTSTITINKHVETKSLIVSGNTVMTLNDGISFSEPSLFEENVMVNWHFGSLFGGIIVDGFYNCVGTLTNKGTIYIDRPVPSFNTPSITCCTIYNEGIININSGALIITFGGLLVNESNGIIDLNEGYGIGAGVDGIGELDNYGIIKKEISNSTSTIGVNLNNLGTIEVLNGKIYFWSSYYQSLNNTVHGTIKGTGVYDISPLGSFTNTGSFEPGASPGTLTVFGDFTSSSNSKLDIELNGKGQGSEYDLLAIQGNAIFNGVVDTKMGFEGDVNDEFIVATTTGTIASCNLTSSVSAEFEGVLYDFNVSCRNNNEIVLTIANKTLGADTFELTNDNIILFPNPVQDHLSIKNNSNQYIISADVIDLNGRIVKHIDFDNLKKDQSISIGEFASGLYLIRINSDNNRITKKLIKI